MNNLQVDDAFFYGLLTAAGTLPTAEAKCRLIDALALVEKHSAVFCLELAKIMTREADSIEVLESIGQLVLAQFHATKRHELIASLILPIVDKANSHGSDLSVRLLMGIYKYGDEFSKDLWEKVLARHFSVLIARSAKA